MAQARLIVCETTSKWAVALRRQLPEVMRGAICETRSLDDCWQQVVAHPVGMALLEVTTANVERLAAELPRYRARSPRLQVAVVGSRDLAAAEWLLRERGAVHVVFSSRAMAPLVRIIHRQWCRVAQEEPGEVLPWRHRPRWAVSQGQPSGGWQGEPDWLRDDLAALP